jgi:cellulose synthase (UDP-forming)
LLEESPVLHAPPAPVADDSFLPSPPTDAERLLYLGPQWRWVTPVSCLGYVLIMASVVLFVRQHLWAVFLLLPLAVGALGTVVSLVATCRSRRDSVGSHASAVTSWRPGRVPGVDVFLPSAGEDLDVLRNTFGHVQALEWAGELHIHVLDDSAREEVRALAADHGFAYHTRPDPGRYKKAGNLRFGCTRSSAEYIFVLDADFVPRPDALHELAPYLEQDDVGIVQSPQYFDVDRRMNWLQRAAGATQILFYRWVQPALDRSRAPICVGTSALYRRSALEAAGGFALIGHSEDIHTGINLLKVGFHVRYVPVIVTKGLCPSVLDQFLNQQYRWCRGSMSLLFSRDFHAIGMTLAQRAAYWSGFLYYLTTAINIFMIPIPTLMMAWLVPESVTMGNYAFVLVAMVTRQTVVPFITLQSESMVSLARVETAYSFSHALSLWDALRGRTDTWVATGVTSTSRTAQRVTRLVRAWCLGVQALVWGAIVVYLPRYGLADWWLLVVFAVANLYVVYPLVWARADAPLIGDLGSTALARLQGRPARHRMARPRGTRALSPVAARGADR